MLGDNPEKSKNPLKKAMRRRNAKTVQFAGNTYVDASDHEYSDDEEEEGGELSMFEADDDGTQAQLDDTSEEQDQAAVVQPLKVRATRDDQAAQQLEPVQTQNILKSTPAEEKVIEETAEAEGEAVFRRNTSIANRTTAESPKSRHGNVRNTDSFFKDDSQETRKISITPRLLRDESNQNSGDLTELKTRGSLDALEKVASPPERKEDKRKKEKKPGMLSGLFKRKDKKSKATEEEPEDNEKVSEESSRSSQQGKDSYESPSPSDTRTPKVAPQTGPERKASKLQKKTPDTSPTKETISTLPPRAETPSRDVQAPAPKASAPAVEAAEPTMRLVGSETRETPETNPFEAPEDQGPAIRQEPPQSSSMSSKLISPIANAFRLSPSEEKEPKPQKARKAAQRSALEDSSPESSPLESHPPPGAWPTQQPPPSHDPPQPPVQARSEHETGSTPIQTKDTLSESPVQISVQEFSPTKPEHPPALMLDISNSSSSSSTPELLTHSPTIKPGPNNEYAPTSKSVAAASPQWSDSALRAYMDDHSEIRDLLIIVHDKSGVMPAGPDHPITGELFKGERKKLDEMEKKLDGLLGGFLERRRNKNQAAPSI